jgi:carbon starvation protein CstA
MRDGIVAGSLVFAFAVFVTAHLTLVAGLAMRPRPWRALVALFVIPLAPFWGYRDRMRARAVFWGVSAAAYVVLRCVAER